MKQLKHMLLFVISILLYRCCIAKIFGKKEQHLITLQLNYYRGHIAKGDCVAKQDDDIEILFRKAWGQDTHPPAGAMHPLIWDNGLAQQASAWAERGAFGHNQRFITAGINGHGENIASMHGPKSYKINDQDIHRMLQGWYDEALGYAYMSDCAENPYSLWYYTWDQSKSLAHCGECILGHHSGCGHFQTLANDKAKKVGCGYALVNGAKFIQRNGQKGDPNEVYFFIVCNTDHLNLRPSNPFPPYKAGKACSGCPGFKCVEGLCWSITGTDDNEDGATQFKQYVGTENSKIYHAPNIQLQKGAVKFDQKSKLEVAKVQNDPFANFDISKVMMSKISKHKNRKKVPPKSKPLPPKPLKKESVWIPPPPKEVTEQRRIFLLDYNGYENLGNLGLYLFVFMICMCFIGYICFISGSVFGVIGSKLFAVFKANNNIKSSQDEIV